MATHTALPNRQRRVLRFVLLCTVATCLFLPFWLTNQLYANDNQPDALGAITGVVKDANGQPIAGVQVNLWLPQPYTFSGWYIARTVTTQVDGSYRFALLPVGVYRIGVADPQARYGASFYPTGSAVQQGSDIPIAGNAVTGIDLTLHPGGRIIATVKVASPYTATTLYAELRQRVDTPSGPFWEYVPSVGDSGSSGIFTFTGLAANSYRLCGGSYGFQFSAYECYDNVYALDNATDLPLASGATISNVTIVLGDGANYAQISGQVTAMDATALANIDVYAIPVPTSGFPIAATTDRWTTAAERSAPLLATSDYYGSLYARTNLTGEYHLSTVVAGQYRLQFIDPAGNYAFEYYNDGRTANEATVSLVSEQQVISNVNVQLAPAGHIAGRVTFQNQPAANTNVLAELKLADGSWQAITQTVTNPNTGQYRIGGLPAGSYRISAQATIYDQYYVYQPYGVYGGSTPADAAEIPLATGGTAETVDITLRGANFAGSLSGQITANGTPIAGIRVALYNSNNLCCTFQLPIPTIYTFTDVNGRYTFSGLANGAFVLGVTDPTGHYATTYYPDQISPNPMSQLYTQDDQAITNVNVALSLAGALSGHVATRDGKAVAGLSVLLTGYDPQLGGYVNIPLDMRTDTTGGYTITGLHPNDYIVCFTGQPYYYAECYGGIESPYGNYGNKSVTVTAGKTTTGIDLIWGPDLRSYLPFVRTP